MRRSHRLNPPWSTAGSLPLHSLADRGMVRPNRPHRQVAHAVDNLLAITLTSALRNRKGAWHSWLLSDRVRLDPGVFRENDPVF